MADPANVLALDDIQMATGLNCQVAVAAAERHRGAGRPSSTRCRARSPRRSRRTTRTSRGTAPTEITDLRASAEDAPVIKLVYSILGQAVDEGASDIHFEPEEGEMRVRFRVDGVLYEAARVPKRMVAGVVSRIKIMSELDIAEKRVPQDGRVSVQRRGPPDRPARHHAADAARRGGRRSASSTRTGAMRTLDELGMEGEARERFEDVVPQAVRRRPGHRADRLRQVDHALRGAAGAQRRREEHHHDRGPGRVPDRAASTRSTSTARRASTFATGLRSMLRADPDIIMVGEIRDAETARIAIEAALTGHMVLSTLHTNDAPGRDHPAGEDGHRDLPDRLGGRLRRRPAPGPHALRALQAAHGRAAGRR